MLRKVGVAVVRSGDRRRDRPRARNPWGWGRTCLRRSPPPPKLENRINMLTRNGNSSFGRWVSVDPAETGCSVAVATSAQSCRGSLGSGPKLVTTGPCVVLRENGEAVSAAGPIWFKLVPAQFRAKRSAGAIMAVPPSDRPRHAGFRPRGALRSGAICNGSAAPQRGRA